MSQPKGLSRSIGWPIAKTPIDADLKKVTVLGPQREREVLNSNDRFVNQVDGVCVSSTKETRRQRHHGLFDNCSADSSESYGPLTNGECGHCRSEPVDGGLCSRHLPD